MTLNTIPAAAEELISVFQIAGDRLDGIEHQHITRGEVLVAEGSASDALYFVISGRFQVTRNGVDLAEIGVGSPIAEISFFTGGPRTATVRAARNSVVARVSTEDYARLSAENPELPGEISRFLALRLAETSARVRPAARAPMARTVALIPAGDGPLDAGFVQMLGAALGDLAPARVVTRQDARDALGEALDGAKATGWFNDLETSGALVLFVADHGDADWAQRVIRQADQVITLGVAGPVPPLSEMERFAASTLPEAHRRLVLLHPAQSDWVTGTSDWLDARPVFMHHHAARGAEEDARRIARFLTGQAVGLVAGGGGAMGALHTGIYEGLRRRGVGFDIFGGTSVGSAMSGAFAMGLAGDEIDRLTGEVFVKNGAMSRFTVPKYSLLDHRHFDHQLRTYYTEGLIEDLWFPYFAVATDLSDNTQRVIRRGPLWQAIRASAAIPGALPPFYDAQGSMLADGGSMDNLPYRTMHALKSGPNVLISFSRDRRQSFNVPYDRLPGRGPLLRRMLLPFGPKPVRAPGIMSVAMRALLARQAGEALDLNDQDWLIRPPVPKGTGFMDWKKHNTLYRVGLETVDKLLADTDARSDARQAFLT